MAGVTKSFLERGISEKNKKGISSWQKMKSQSAEMRAFGVGSWG